MILFKLQFKNKRFSYDFFDSEAALQRCSNKKAFLKYAANSQENTDAEVQHIFRTPENSTYHEVKW